METERYEEAARTLAGLRGTANIADIQEELDEIHANILWHKEHSVTSFKVFFQQPALFSRMWRAWMLQFLQQMSGATGIRYYQTCILANPYLFLFPYTYSLWTNGFLQILPAIELSSRGGV